MWERNYIDQDPDWEEWFTDLTVPNGKVHARIWRSIDDVYQCSVTLEGGRRYISGDLEAEDLNYAFKNAIAFVQRVCGPIIVNEGYDDLWCWFSGSRASWLTLPRVLMHEMPDEWQAEMAKLLDVWDETWVNTGTAEPTVQLKENGRFVKTPEWMINYRRPDKAAISECRELERSGEL